MMVLQVAQLHKAFGGNRALQGLSLSVAAGRMVAVIGPNGSGKSTLFNVLTGQLAPDSGTAHYKGQAITGRSPQAIWRLGIGRTFQIPETFASLTVIENVQMALFSHRRWYRNFWRSAPLLEQSEAMALLAKVGLSDLAHSPCGVLSYGDTKRVELAIALANSPGLLLMDEPTAGMAVHERQALMALVQQLVKDTQLAVLFTEHSMDVVFGFADTVLVLARGQCIAQGPPQAIRTDVRVREVYFGMSSPSS